MKTINDVLRVSALLLAASCPIEMTAQAQQSTLEPSKVTVDQDGTVHVPAYELPLSIYMSEKAKRSYIKQRVSSPAVDFADADVVKAREALDLLLVPLLDRTRAAYPVIVEEKRIAGIRVDVVTPRKGLTKQNRERVLINLHGGGFNGGAGRLQLLESIPIASTAKIKVISVDYRLAPEYKHPAASEDVAAVYKELLKQYKSQNIGIYGCSAGGSLTAMSIAWFQKEKLPRPGAIGVFCGADLLMGGDSRYTVTPLSPLFGLKDPPPPAVPNPPPTAVPYLEGMDLKDPLISPTLHREILAQFPPALVITGTRDFLASSVIYAHSQLVKAGVDAELHVWEGMWHGFFVDVDIPESKEMYEVTAKFFNAHLGKSN